MEYEEPSVLVQNLVGYVVGVPLGLLGFLIILKLLNLG